jgi:CRISPR-associated endonuclease Csn1
MRYVLGLDLGPTSIGWAVAALDAEGRPHQLIDANSRIFLAMVEADTKVPKNKNRREKRLMRKQINRYKLRRSALMTLLMQNHFFGDDSFDPINWERQLNRIGNPFQLRAEALERKLNPMELGRVLLHLLKRRGYKSNRGAKFASLLSDLNKRGVITDFNDTDAFEETDETGPVDDKVRETGAVLNGIRLLKQAMNETEWNPGQPCATIAQLMVRLKEREKFPEIRRPHTLTRSEFTKKGKETPYHLYASRELYEDEFDLIWTEQIKHYPQLLSDDLKIKVHHAIFFQRPLQSQRGKVGKCSFEIKKSRAAKALLDAQEFLLLDDLNKLKYSLPRAEGQMALSDEQRKALLTALADPSKVNERGQLSWAETKKIVNLPSKVKFNLELTSKNGLIGNRTQLAMLRTIPGKWLALGSDGNTGQGFSPMQIQLIQDIVHIEDKQALFNRLTNHYALPVGRNPWRFTPEEAFKLITLELNEGYVKHCSQAIKKLLPPMRQGLMYHDAVEAAGYLRRDQTTAKVLAKLPEPSDIANPIVQKALFETRRLVNELIGKFGKPALVRLEMARDMKASKIHRAEMEKRQKSNQKSNDSAADEIRALAKTYPDLGIRVSRETIVKYKLWQEQGKSCAYSYSENNNDRKISDRMLFDGTVEVDHIYPLSVSLDDSYMNKVLCFRAENVEKGRKTPWQAWNGTNKYSAILRRFERTNLPDYPVGKLRRLKDDKFDANADFVAAQLNDTRYICVAVRNYLATLGYNDQELQVTRGQMTGELRRLWGLVDVLPRTQNANETVDSETDEVSEKTSEKKKDRGDHRHHAIDAIVTALVDRSIFADLMRRYRYREERGTWPDQPLECPIPNLRSEVERTVMNNVVSHAANRKVSGGLHNELPYGLGTYIEKAVSLKKLLQQPDVIHSVPDGSAGKTLEGGERWIADADIRVIVQQWLLGYEGTDRGKRKNYPLPLLPDGKEIGAVDVVNRCFVKRAGVEAALAKVDNPPGKKTWIVDHGVREVLLAWLSTHRVKDVLADPPRMPRKDGNMAKSHPILSVRLASKSSGMVRFKEKPQIFEKSSNHHVAIFKRTRGENLIERKGIFIDMLEAARRVHDQPIVRKDAAQLKQTDSTINPDDWRFEMALCGQDMVLWDDESVPDEHRHLGPPVYRLQKMSGSNNALIFRHFSVTSTSDTDSRGIIRCTPGTMRCRKIRISAAGQWEVISDD